MAQGSDGEARLVAVEEERMSGQIDAVAAFDEIIIKLREPPVVSADAREIATQLRALADTVRAGRDEWVVATARKAQCLALASPQPARRPWWPWKRAS